MLRKVLSHKQFIHFLVLLGFISLVGYLKSGDGRLIFFTVLSFAGAVCGGFILLVDMIRNNHRDHGHEKS